MKKIVSLLLNFISFHESKFLLLSLKHKKLYTFIFKILGLGIIYLVFIFIPLFFLSNNLLWLFILLALLSLFVFFLIIRSIFLSGSIEKLDNNIITYQMDKSNLIKFLNADYIFVIKVSLFIATVLFVIHFLIYTLLLGFGSITLLMYLYIIIIYCAIYYIGIFLLLFIRYLIKMDRNVAFMKIDSTKRVNNKFIIVAFILSVIIIALLLFTLLYSLKLNIVLSIIFSLFLSITISMLCVFLLNKINFFNKVFWIIFLEKVKELFFQLSKKVNIQDIKSLLISILFFYPIIISIIFFIVLSIISAFLNINLWIKINSSILLGLFFTMPFFKKKHSFNKIKKAFTFTITLFSFFVIVSLLSQFNLKIQIDNSSSKFIFKDFLLPLTNYINEILIKLQFLFSQFGIYLSIILPLLFFLIIFLVFKINQFFEVITKRIDENIKRSLTLDNTPMLFGDSLSLYPFALSSIAFILGFTFLFIEIKPFGNLIANLFKTFEIEEIFHLSIFTPKSIHKTIYILAVVLFIISLLKLLLKLISAIFSHIILFTDELIFISNKGYKKSIIRIPLNKINYVVIKQNILEKFFNIGNIYIETFDKEGLIKISGVTNIKEKSILIMDKIKVLSEK